MTLSGADADKFEIVNNELFLKAGTKLDYETQPQFKVTIEADDPAFGSTPDSSVELLIDITDVNEAPTLTLNNTLTSLAELTNTATPIKVADITVSDDALGNTTLGLNGADADKFEIVGTELYLKSGAILDYETQSKLQVSVTVEDPTIGNTPDALADLAIAITDVNEAPTLTLSNAITSLPELTNTATHIKVASITVGDDALGSNTLSLGGSDADKFEIVGDEVFLKAGTVLDYETQSQFQFTINVDDPTVSNALDSSVNLAIAITDVNEVPTLAVNNAITSLSEATNTANRVKVADIGISDDALGSNTLSLSGADANQFEIVGAEVFLKAGTILDYETQSQFQFTVNVDDPSIGNTPDSNVNLAITITDVNEAPMLAVNNAITSLSEATNTANRVKVADVVISDDALGSNTLSLNGADANKFEIVGKVLYLKSGTVLDYEIQSQLEVTVAVDDPTVGNTPDAVMNLAIAITNSNEAPSLSLANTVIDLSDTTNTTTRLKVADIHISDDALGTEALTLIGTDADKFEIVGTELYLKAGTVLSHSIQPQLAVTVTVDDPTVGSTPDASVNLAIAIVTPELSLRQGISALEDGSTQVFATVDVATGLAEMTFELENTSSEPLDLTGITIGGVNAEDFTFVSTVPSGQLAAGASTTLTIRFDPSAIGTRTATLILTSQDQQEDIYTFALVGTGTNTSTYTGTSGNDTIISQGGNHTIDAGAGNDRVIGSSGNEYVVAGDGDDQVMGNGGNDRINGNAGNDILRGSTGKDVLNGGAGNDILQGGWDSDILTGGKGADRFRYRGASRRKAFSGSLIRRMDVIKDFNSVEGDRIHLDYDNNIATTNLPTALFNAGQQHGKSLAQAAHSAFEDWNRRKQGKQSLRSSQAVLFQWKGRTFLCVNDNNAKFSEKRDFIVEVKGIVMQPRDSGRTKLTANQYFI